MRGLLATTFLFLGASVGVAQDMPLFTFAKLGAKWEKIRGVIEFVPIPAPKAPMTCAALTLDGSTLFAGYADRSAIWAYPVKKDGEPDLTAGAPYAPLRIVEGYDNSREAREKREAKPPTLAVTALAVDTAGRLYAGTSQGIQVFDPTGRLSGVLPLPKPGTVEAIAWGREGGTGRIKTLTIDLDGAWQREMK
jgi:hypothetical protein